MIVLFSLGQNGYHPVKLWSPDTQCPVRLTLHTSKDDVATEASGVPVMTSHHSVGPGRRCNSSKSPTNIVFLKLHKTGGTTVSNLLARYALNHDLNIALPEHKPVGPKFHCFGPFREYRVLPLAKSQPYHLLFNHMIYNRTALNNVMPKDAFYVAIMREPVKRFLSAIYYFGALSPPARHDTDNAAFKHFISDANQHRLERRGSVYNSIVSDTGLPWKEQKKTDSVKKHIERLDEDLDLMMVMEHFLESMILFKRRACLSLKDVIFLKTNARRNLNTHNITREDTERLRSWQMADHMVYDHFYPKFWDQVRREGNSFPQEVDHFRSVLTRVKTYCSSDATKWDVLVIRESEWNEEFALNGQDCQWMRTHEKAFQKLLLARAYARREVAGYKESRTPIPQWEPECENFAW